MTQTSQSHPCRVTARSTCHCQSAQSRPLCLVTFLASYLVSLLCVPFALHPYFRAQPESCESNRAIFTLVELHNYQFRESYAWPHIQTPVRPDAAYLYAITP